MKDFDIKRLKHFVDMAAGSEKYRRHRLEFLANLYFLLSDFIKWEEEEEKRQIENTLRVDDVQCPYPACKTQLVPIPETLQLDTYDWNYSSEGQWRSSFGVSCPSCGFKGRKMA